MNRSTPALLAAAVLLPHAATAAPVLLAGFDGTSGMTAIQDASAAGITAVLTGDNDFAGNNGDAAGQWGTDATLGPAPSTTDQRLSASGTDGYFQSIQITNNTGNDVILDAFHYSIKRGNADTGSQALNITYEAGDLDDTEGATIYFESVLGKYAGAYSAFSLDLSSVLNDVTLANGESATIKVELTAFTTGNFTFLDNLAVSGEVVPEPSSLALLGLGGLVIARRRRR